MVVFFNSFFFMIFMLVISVEVCFFGYCMWWVMLFDEMVCFVFVELVGVDGLICYVVFDCVLVKVLVVGLIWCFLL